MTTDATAPGAATDPMQAMAEASKPVVEHTKLEPFAGEFRATVKMWMDPAGEPMVSTGVMKNQWILGGRFLEQVYEDDQGFFSGRGHWGYNRTDGRYEGFWIDTATTMMMTESGQMDREGHWTMTSTMSDPCGSGTMHKRTTIELVSPDEHVMTTYIRPEGMGSECKCMEISFIRK